MFTLQKYYTSYYFTGACIDCIDILFYVHSSILANVYLDHALKSASLVDPKYFISETALCESYYQLFVEFNLISNLHSHTYSVNI